MFSPAYACHVGRRETDGRIQSQVGGEWRRVVLGKEPGEELLCSKNGIQQERAGEAKEDETCRILLAGHLHIRVNRRYAIDKPLNREA